MYSFKKTNTSCKMNSNVFLFGRSLLPPDNSPPSQSINSETASESRVEVKTVVGISLRFDSIFVAEISGAEAETTVLGPFGTNVCFDQNPPKATDSTSGEAVIKNGIKMLDSDLELEQGWMRCDSKNIISIGQREFVSAQKVVEHLLRYVLAQIKTEGRVKVVLAIPSQFTEKQRVGLEQAAKQICDEVRLLPEAEAVWSGIAKKRDVVNGKVLTVDLSMTECTCVLIALGPESKVIRLVEKVDYTLFSENVRQNQRAWLKRNQEDAYPSTHTPESQAEVERLQNSSYTVVSVTEAALDQFLKVIDSVMEAQNVATVKVILLLGDCRVIPLLNNLLYWKFSNAQIITPSTAEVRELVALGASLLR